MWAKLAPSSNRNFSSLPLEGAKSAFFDERQGKARGNIFLIALLRRRDVFFADARGHIQRRPALEDVNTCAGP